MASQLWSVSPKGRWLAMAAALVVHALILLLLFWKLGETVGLVDIPSINVVLTPRPYSRPMPSEPKVAKERATSAPSHFDAKAPIPHFPPNPAQTEALPSNAVLPEGESGGVRSALRGLLGCQHPTLLGLTPDERRKCEEHIAAEASRNPAASAPKLNFDLHGEFTANPEPYLQRRPRDGCKARAAGDAAPGPGRTTGKIGAELGVDCGLSF